MYTQQPHRYVVVASVPLAALGALPILVPDVVAEWHVVLDRAIADLLRGAVLRHVILLLGTLDEVQQLQEVVHLVEEYRDDHIPVLRHTQRVADSPERPHGGHD